MKELEVFIYALEKRRYRNEDLYKKYKKYTNANKYQQLNKREFDSLISRHKKIKVISSCISCNGGIVEVM